MNVNIKGVGRQSPIVNPMSRTVIRLEVNDQLQTQLHSELSPRDTCKILSNLIFDMIFGYAEALVDNTTKSKIEQP